MSVPRRGEMMKYSLGVKDETLSVYLGEKVLFGGLAVRAYPDSADEGFLLKLEGLQGNEAWFENRKAGINASVRLENHGNFFSLRISGSIQATAFESERKFSPRFSPDCAIAIDIERVCNMNAFVANYQKCDSWCRTVIDSEACRLPDRIQGLLMSSAGGYYYAAPTCDSVYRSSLRGNPDGALTLYVRSNDLRGECKNTVALVCGRGKDPYALVPDVTECALRIMGKKGKLRNQRRYPEVLEYLGWSARGAFKTRITQDALLKKASELRDKYIPVRWFLFDGDWCNTTEYERGIAKLSELYSFDASEKSFPKGLRGCIKEMKNTYGMVSGISHIASGHLDGIDPTGEIAEKYNELLIRSNNKTVHSSELAKAFEYYNRQYCFYQSCGAEFVKVDNQGFINNSYKNISSIGESASNVHFAIDAAAAVTFDGSVINSMGMASESFWNRPISSVCRFSGELLSDDKNKFEKHLLQCSFNSLFQGCVYFGDWDSFQSHAECSEKDAVLRAISGGPVYLSDSPGDSQKDKIMPLVFSDGRVIRLGYSALPTPDCLTENSEINGKPFKIFNRVGNYGILCAFNTDRKNGVVSGTVRSEDMELYGDYVCYDWFAKKILKPEHALKLKNHDDFRLYIYIPSFKGRAFIGLTDKYMSPATLNRITENICSVREGGKLGIYSKNSLKYIKVNGERTEVHKVSPSFYECEIHEENAIISF